MKEALDRCLELLAVVGQFMKDNPLAEEMTTFYDEATCDGSCLAEDCRSAAQHLRLEIVKNGRFE